MDIKKKEYYEENKDKDLKRPRERDTRLIRIKFWLNTNNIEKTIKRNNKETIAKRGE